ncbi:MAG TPA: transporter substrate-binding domain-containing protein, partial [Candidatus Pelethocola excrementipullorum]|nr:transporter substrate-binding domain-containing protein [Candidatus Pelethocola excrementipullorum]
MQKRRKGLLVCLAVMLIGIFANCISVMGQTETKIIVGTNAEYAPFEYRDSAGKLTGFDIDLM